MKITFNAMDCGLGNQGGTSTIIKSANTLVDLGHEVYIIDTGKNQHTWTKLKAKHLIIKDLDEIPDSNIIIATGFNTVRSTIKINTFKHIPIAHWIRGWELWKMNEQEIYEKVLSAPTTKLVNSIGLRDKLKGYGIEPHVVYPGYDFGDLYPKDLKKYSTKEIILGGLYHGGKHRETKRTDWIIVAANELKKKYNVKLWMFGVDKNPNDLTIDYYVQSPDVKEKNDFYNKVDIWLAPSELEGLHLPPAEAMMCLCAVVGTDAELSGMKDYLIHKVTGLVAENNFKSFMDQIEVFIKDPFLRSVCGRLGSERIEEIGDRKKNMEKLVNLLNERIR